MRICFIRALVVLLGLFLVTGCATNSRHVAGFTASSTDSYMLDSGDRVRVIVFGQQDLSNSFAVDGAGYVSLPLIGNVPARGLTTQQFEQSVAARLKQGYLKNPKVTAEVEIYRPFFALGEVNAPGRYAFVHGMSARKAVAIAGGFSPRAVQDRVKIVRQYQGREITAVVPIDHPLRPGDTLQAMERWF